MLLKQPIKPQMKSTDGELPLSRTSSLMHMTLMSSEDNKREGSDSASLTISSTAQLNLSTQCNPHK